MSHAAGIIYLTNGKVLLVRRSSLTDSNPGTWAFPGGKIENDAPAMLTALRESKEEVGFAPDDIDYLFDIDGFSLFLALNSEFTPILSDESDGYVWADPDNLPQPMHPGNEDAIRAIMSVFGKDSHGMDEAHCLAARIEFADAWAVDKSAREVDTNGWFEVKNNPLSRVGIFDYLGSQLKDAPDPSKVYRVLRPEEEVGSLETIESFKLIPWIDNHVMLGREEDGMTRPEEKGIQGVVGQDVKFQDGYLLGNIKVWSSAMADLINSGKKELSAGYRCDYDWTPGVWNGQPYDCVQRNIRGNHLALVEKGRMGSSVAVLDTAEINMDSLPTKEENAMALSSETEGGTGITLEDATQKFGEVVEMVDKIIPILAKLKPMLQAEEEEPSADEEEVEINLGGEEPDDDEPEIEHPEVEDEQSEEEKAKAAEEAGKKAAEDREKAAMDEADMFKRFEARITSRNKLADALKSHIGTFDCAQMDETDVASYGCKKLGLKAPKGQELAFLNGYLSAAKNQTKKTTTAPAMDGDGDWLKQQSETLGDR